MAQSVAPGDVATQTEAAVGVDAGNQWSPQPPPPKRARTAAELQEAAARRAAKQAEMMAAVAAAGNDRPKRVAGEKARAEMRELVVGWWSHVKGREPRRPPGDIATTPDAKIVFNAPYDDKVINSSAHRIGWAVKTTNIKRLGVDPGSGVLDPKENALIAVSCDAFAYGQEDTNNDRVTIEWTNTPEGPRTQFRRAWFRGAGLIREKALPIEYNP